MQQNSTLRNLEQSVANFVQKRDWTKYHTPKNLAMSIAIEAAEIMELFQWYTNEEASLKVLNEKEIHEKLADELADVMIYCLSLAHQTEIDLELAITEKLAKNEIRFPIKKVSGKLGPYVRIDERESI